MPPSDQSHKISAAFRPRCPPSDDVNSRDSRRVGMSSSVPLGQQAELPAYHNHRVWRQGGGGWVEETSTSQLIIYLPASVGVQIIPGKHYPPAPSLRPGSIISKGVGGRRESRAHMIE